MDDQDDLGLDLDGDGVPDVAADGLPARAAPGGTSAPENHWSSVVHDDARPMTHPYSPMGQLEHVGAALHSRTARTGWRRRLIRAMALLWLLAVAGSLVGGLIAAAR